MLNFYFDFIRGIVKHCCRGSVMQNRAHFLGHGNHSGVQSSGPASVRSCPWRGTSLWIFLKCTRWFKLCALFRRFLFFSREQTAGVSTRSAPRSVPATDLPHGNPFVSCFPQEGRVGRLLKQGLWCSLYTRRAVRAGAMPRGRGPGRGPRGNGTRI